MLYQSIPFKHDHANHIADEYVRDEISTNSIESFWALMKRSYKGYHHFWTFRHTPPYLDALQGRLNNRHLSTLKHMQLVIERSDGKQMTYRELIGRSYQARLLGIWRKPPANDSSHPRG